jgi:hypothetical protein
MFGFWELAIGLRFNLGSNLKIMLKLKPPIDSNERESGDVTRNSFFCFSSLEMIR